MKPRIKTNLILTAVSLILALSLIAAQQVGEPPAVLLERAIQLETVDGDLRDAIELYQRIISQNGNNRAVAAKAFLHLGLCHLKLGNKEAQSAFQKVIDDYSDQSETAKQAREQLSMLLRTQTQLAKGREMNIRRIYDGTGPEWGNALSSAGRHLVYTDWETGDMAVVDLTTREHRRLTSTGGLRSPSGDMGETSIFSPDDKMKPKFEFLSISPDGQRIRKLDQSLIATGINRFHPGGRQLAFSFGQSRIELWALENFLQPVLK
jgi:hypothetical protein